MKEIINVYHEFTNTILREKARMVCVKCKTLLK